MIRIYYHIYAVEGVEEIIDEQLNLIEKYFNFPYILNVGISIADNNVSTKNIIKKFYDLNKTNYFIRDVRAKASEFTTLDLIESDLNIFGNSDYILYLHTKGASKINNVLYPNIQSWREMMQYFNLEKCDYVFKLFDKTEYNTYGVLFCNMKGNDIYAGNFWWAKASYLKTLDMKDVDKNRNNAEWSFIQNGKNWKPYSNYNLNHTNYYYTKFERTEYAK